jgi:hypothetical protein
MGVSWKRMNVHQSRSESSGPLILPCLLKWNAAIREPLGRDRDSRTSFTITFAREVYQKRPNSAALLTKSKKKGCGAASTLLDRPEFHRREARQSLLND